MEVETPTREDVVLGGEVESTLVSKVELEVGLVGPSCKLADVLAELLNDSLEDIEVEADADELDGSTGNGT